MIRSRSLWLILLLLLCPPLTLHAGGVPVETGTSTSSSTTGATASYPVGTPVGSSYLPAADSTTLANGNLFGYTTTSGNLIHSERDIAIKGRSNLPLVRERAALTSGGVS